MSSSTPWRWSDGYRQDQQICTAFVESEIVSPMTEGVARERAIQGQHESEARSIAGLAGSGNLEDDVYMDGGATSNRGLAGRRHRG
ncbi:MAG: hypothetical protein GY859_05130 [Desulfobacterales bacterium]|nr:hypothetical protein [Desulfobacterales bacterium]